MLSQCLLLMNRWLYRYKSNHFFPPPTTVSDKLKPDMVLEDVDSDNEWQQKQEVQDQSMATSSSLAPPPTQTANGQENNHATSQISQISESETKMSQEDAETQTGRWTPFIESIKREAEDVALATMEER